MANFYNISTIIDPSYNSNQFIKMESNEHQNKIITFLDNRKDIITGDIIFAGSPHDRQGYGFFMVDKRENTKLIFSEQGVDLPFENDSLRDYLIENKIKYRKLFTGLNKFYNELIGFLNLEEVINNYKMFNLW